MNLHLVLFQAQTRPTGIDSGPEIVFKSVPGTDDVNRFFGELQALTGLILSQNLFDLPQDLTLANRTTPMGTLVLVGMKVPIDFENADFQLPLNNDLTILFLEFRLFSHK